MKAIILSAGQGRRLFPLTSGTPKCAVEVHGRPLLDWQIDQLHRSGIRSIVVVTGFGASQVDRLIARHRHRSAIRTIFNPFFNVADNLASCWVARAEMDEDFVLLNGDTLFEAAVLEHLLSSPVRPVTLARDHKAHYDEDDMKVELSGDRLVSVAKDLPRQRSHAESIGMLLFRDRGPMKFRVAIERAMRRPDALQQWYLTVIATMARSREVWTRSIEGRQWSEVDYPLDLVRASRMVEGWTQPDEDRQVRGRGEARMLARS